MACKKILHVTFDMRIGGTEMVIKSLIEGSDPKQFEMSIFCIEEPIGPWGIDLQNSGIKITAVERKPSFDMSLVFAIRDHIKENKIDVLHCHQYTPWVYGVLAAFATNTQVIFTEHGRFYPDTSSWKRKLINPWLCKITDHITSISNATKLALIEFENIPESRIGVIYNGISAPVVDPDKVIALKRELCLKNDTIVLGTIARLDPIKNHKMMLDAFALILKTHPNTVLIIVGDGEERESIKRQITELGIIDKVIMPGYDPQPQHYLALMDIFLLSSLSEGTSMTLLEAMALSKPCVVTDAGGNKEVVLDNVTGKVSRNNDANDFAKNVIHTLLPNVHRKYAEAALQVFKSTFHNDSMISRYATIWRRKK
jgi:glycosyltransferase involved in cell wall biosynthesis